MDAKLKSKSITIYSPNSQSSLTAIPERGGVISSLVMQGNNGPRELLFQHDYFWNDKIDDLPGGMPFCFPVFARLERQGRRGAYLYDGCVYYLPIHGFTWNLPWEVEKVTPNQLSLMFQDNVNTRKMYPFKFSVKLDYEMRDNEVRCLQTYCNLGKIPMPYSAGFHPYFLTPLKDKVQLFFHPERRFLYNKTFTDLIGEGEIFSLPRLITDKSLNEQLTKVGADKEIQLHFPEGDILHINAQGLEDENLFSFVQLYTMEEKPFFCAEPIMSPPNALNTVQGMRWLLPGEVEHGLLKIWLANERATPQIRSGLV